MNINPSNPSPLKIRIASPCSASWREMKGDQRSRFCAQCSKNVYDLSGMSASEAAALFEAKEGRLCVRVYQRADGTVLHGSDCPVGLGRYRQRMRAFWGAGVSAVVLMFAHARAFAGSAIGTSNPGTQAAIMDATASFKSQITIGMEPNRPIMGIPAVPMPTPVPTPPPPPPSPFPTLPPAPSPIPHIPGHSSVK